MEETTWASSSIVCKGAKTKLANRHPSVYFENASSLWAAQNKNFVAMLLEEIKKGSEGGRDLN